MSDLLEQWEDPALYESHTQVPAALASRLTDMPDEIVGRHSYYERMHALLAVASVARTIEPTTVQHDNPPSDDERRLGAVLGQAFHQGCQLDDIALAAGLSNDEVVAIGKRTIRRTGWLKRI